MPLRATMAASTLCAPLVRGPRVPLSTAVQTSRSRLLTAANATLGVSVQTPEAVLLPQALVVPVLPPDSAVISLGAGALWYDDQRVALTRWFEPSRVPWACLPGQWAANDDIGVLLEDWPAMLGGGEGLTPFGDDVLCGALLGLRAMGHPARTSLSQQLAAADLDGATTPISAALLRAAMAGWCIPQVAGLVKTLAAGSGFRVALDELLAVGHSSGHGLLAGLARVVAPVESTVAA